MCMQEISTKILLVVLWNARDHFCELIDNTECEDDRLVYKITVQVIDNEIKRLEGCI